MSNRDEISAGIVDAAGTLAWYVIIGAFVFSAFIFAVPFVLVGIVGFLYDPVLPWLFGIPASIWLGWRFVASRDGKAQRNSLHQPPMLLWERDPPSVPSKELMAVKICLGVIVAVFALVLISCIL
jgi:hypothetical protein